HARAEGNGVERHAVAPQRGLALGAADDVIPCVLVEVLARRAHDLLQILEVDAGKAQGGNLRVGIFDLHGHSLTVVQAAGMWNSRKLAPECPGATCRPWVSFMAKLRPWRRAPLPCSPLRLNSGARSR